MDWRPVKTCPRDGTPVWLLTNHPGVFEGREVGGFAHGEWYSSDRCEVIPQPEGWHPYGSS